MNELREEFLNKLGALLCEYAVSIDVKEDDCGGQQVALQYEPVNKPAETWFKSAGYINSCILNYRKIK